MSGNAIQPKGTGQHGGHTLKRARRSQHRQVRTVNVFNDLPEPGASPMELQRYPSVAAVRVFSESEQLFTGIDKSNPTGFVYRLAEATKASAPVALGFRARLRIPGVFDSYYVRAHTKPGRYNFEHAIFSTHHSPYKLMQCARVRATCFEQLSAALERRNITLHVFTYRPDKDDTLYCGSLNDGAENVVVVRENGFGHFERFILKQEEVGEYVAPEVAYKTLDDAQDTDESELESDNDIPLSQDSTKALLAKTKRYALSGGRPEIVNVTRQERPVALTPQLATAALAYVGNITVYTRPNTCSDIERLLRVISEDSFLGYEHPDREIRQRFALSLGFNRPFSPDYRRNKLVSACVARVAEHSPFNVGNLGFLWRVPWTFDGKTLQNGEEYQEFLSWFKTLRKKHPTQAKEFLRSHRAPVPYTLIRDTLKNDETTKQLTRTLRAASTGNTTVFLQLLDDDTESLRDMSHQGLLFRSDKRLQARVAAGHGLPDVDASCYRIATAKVPHLAFSVAVDQVVRVATATEFPLGVYFPEPSSKIRIPDDEDTVPENFQEAGERNGKGEMPKLMRAILRRRKPVAVSQLEYLKRQFDYSDASLVTTAPQRMLTMFYRGSKNFGVVSESGRLLRWSEDIITKVQSGTSQSHANARNWAKNIINVFHLVRDARLNISDKRNILTSALSKLYNSYDPMSLAKLSTAAPFRARLEDAVTHYDVFLLKPLPSQAHNKVYKARVSQAFIAQMKAVKQSSTRQQLLTIVTAIIGPEQCTAVHQAARAAGKAIRGVLDSRLCFDEAALMKQLIMDSLQDLNKGQAPTDAQFAALPRIHKLAFHGDITQVRAYVSTHAGAKSQLALNVALPIHAAVCHMAEHGYVEGLMTELATAENLVQIVGDTSHTAITLLLQRMPKPYKAMIEIIAILDAEPAVKQGLVCVSSVASELERSAPLLAAVRHQPFNTALHEFMLTTLACDPNQGASLTKHSFRLPLHDAIDAGSVSAVRCLKKHGARFTKLDELCPEAEHRWDRLSIETPLIQCESHSNTRVFHAMAKLVLECGADPNEVGDDEFAPLARAAERGERDYCRLLLQHNADPNQRDYNSISTLAHAFDNDDKVLAAALFEAGIDLSGHDSMNHPELRRIYCNSIHQCDGFAEKFRQAGLDLNGPVDQYTFTVTYEVAESEDSENPFASDEGTHFEQYQEEPEHDVNLLEVLYRSGVYFYEIKAHIEDYGCELDETLFYYVLRQGDVQMAQYICKNFPTLVEEAKTDFDPDSPAYALERLAYPPESSGSSSDSTSGTSSSSSSEDDSDESDEDEMY